jgi:hypothetical protein
MADNTARIAQIEATLAKGVSKATIDGNSVELDLASLRAELVRLKLTDDLSQRRRPSFLSVDMSGGAYGA